MVSSPGIESFRLVKGIISVKTMARERQVNVALAVQPEAPAAIFTITV
jgi:hypothetical protein